MKYKTVIVDDNMAFADMLTSGIAWAELDAVVSGTAYGGPDALRLIMDKRPDIVITDIQMPGMDGLELIQRARQYIPDARFILITAYDDFHYAYQAVKLHVFDFLLKPCPRFEIERVIRNAVKEMEAASERDLPQYPPQVRAVVDYMQEHLAAEITLETMAEALHVSESTLARTIKNHFNMRYGELLTQMRMERAKHLLRNSTLRLNEIAEQVGYKSYIAFYKAFIRSEEMTPTDYRSGGKAP